MNSIDLIKAAAVDATNNLLVQHDIPPIEIPTLTDKVNDEQPPLLTEMVWREGQKSISAYLANTRSNGEAITAYQQNAGEHANAWKLLEEMGKKAAMFDELLPALKAYINTDWYTAEHNRSFNDILHLIQRANDLK